MNYNRNYDKDGTEQRKLTKALNELRKTGYFASKTALKNQYKPGKCVDHILTADNTKYFLQDTDKNLYENGYAQYLWGGNPLLIVRILKKHNILFIWRGDEKCFTIYNTLPMWKDVHDFEARKWYNEYMSYKIEKDVHNMLLTDPDAYDAIFNDKNVNGFLVKYFKYEYLDLITTRLYRKYYNYNISTKEYNTQYKNFYNENIRAVKLAALKERIKKKELA